MSMVPPGEKDMSRMRLRQQIEAAAQQTSGTQTFRRVVEQFSAATCAGNGIARHA